MLRCEMKMNEWLQSLYSVACIVQFFLLGDSRAVLHLGFRFVNLLLHYILLAAASFVTLYIIFYSHIPWVSDSEAEEGRVDSRIS